MRTSTYGVGRLLCGGCLLVFLIAIGGRVASAADAPPGDAASAQNGEHEVKSKPRLDGLTALAAALAMGIAALGTGFAQARIGAAGMGAIAEDPKRLGGVIMLVAIPETVAILGFVIAYLIIS